MSQVVIFVPLLIVLLHSLTISALAAWGLHVDAYASARVALLFGA